MTDSGTAAALLFDLPRAATALRQGTTTTAALVDASLARIGRLDPELRAIAWCDPERARRLAVRADAVPSDHRGPLHGLPLGVKDIFDTAHIPTEHGSPIFDGRVPATSAAVVTALEDAGAIVVAKTVTTPLAFLAPGPTRNPWNLLRTPGGSSMGSAVAVATGMLPGSIGTQSSGSVIRPAAYCGIVGFKPTQGRLPTEGALAFSSTLDQVGVFARSADGVAMLSAAITREPLELWSGAPLGEAARVLAPVTEEWRLADPVMLETYERALRDLGRAGVVVVRRQLPPALDDGVPALRVIAAYEASHSLGRSVLAHRDLLSHAARAFFTDSARIPMERYEKALADRASAIAQFDDWIADCDAVATPPTLGEAPGLDTTGDPRFCSPWTFVGAPAIVLPVGSGQSGLPLGLQLVGPRGHDADLLGLARFVEEALDAHPRIPPNDDRMPRAPAGVQ